MKENTPLGSATKERTTHRGWVTAALLLSTFMTAIEVTIVATAMPRIVADLGGFALLSWVFSAYLLTQVVSIPIYGKLADLYGRKPVFLSGVVLFLISSFLCGFSRSMPQLIAFRALQGLGGGAVQPIAVTIIGDLYKPQERHRIQGMLGSIFAFSAIAGPTLGAFIVEIGHWPWIFYLNIPLGILAFIVLWAFLFEEKHPRDHRIDYLGAVILVIATTTLLLALLEGGTAWAWLSWQSLALISASLIFYFIFGAWERKVPEPIFPLWILKHPLMLYAGLATFLNGAIMIGYSAMIPTHVQGVLGESVLVAGFTIAGMSIGWPLASFTAGRVMKKIGYRKTAIYGATLVLIGATSALALSRVSAAALAVAAFIVGLGLGFQSNAYIITIQSAVNWRQRGVVTANNIFMRTLGSSVGVAAFGGVLNSMASGYLLSRTSAAGSEREALNLMNQLLDPLSRALTGPEREAAVQALSLGMRGVFSAVVIVAAAGIYLAIKLPANVKPSA